MNSILRHVAEILEYTSDEQLEELYEKTAWYFDAKLGKPGACYDIFKNAVQDSSGEQLILFYRIQQNYYDQKTTP